MSNAHLQSLFFVPRNSSNPKEALSHTSQFSTGEDGKLYKLASEEDRLKFHILSDAEVEEEARKSQEMARTLLSLNQKKSTSPRARTVKLGTASRSKKIEKRAWEKKLDATENENNDEGKQHKESEHPEQHDHDDSLRQSFADLQKKYTANLAVVEKLLSEKVKLEEKVNALQRKLLRSKSLNQYQSDQQFKKSTGEQFIDQNEPNRNIDTMKKNYQENLNLIGQLYSQHNATERDLITCQNDLLTIKKNLETKPKGKTGSAIITDDSILRYASETNEKYLRNLKIIEQLFGENKRLVENEESMRNQLRSLKRNQVAGVEKNDVVMNNPRLITEKAMLNHTAPGAFESHNEVHDEDDDDLPQFEADGGDECMPDTDGGRNVENAMQLKRSASPTLPSSGSNDAYMNKLRISEEKYFAKKKASLERENQKKLEQEMYEYELEQKRLRASKVKHKVVEINGIKKTVVVAEGMPGMAERDKLAAQRRLDREIKKKEKAEAEAEEIRKAADLEKKKVERLTKAIAKSREKSKEVEKNNQADLNAETKKNEKTQTPVPPPKLSPAEVTEKMQKQQLAWEAKLKKMKEEQKAKLGQTKQDSCVQDMLRRQEEREAELKKKREERELHAEMEERKAAIRERERRERLHRHAQRNGEAAKEKAAKEKLEETQKMNEENEKAASKKKKQQADNDNGVTGSSKYRNAAEMIKALTSKPRVPKKDNESSHMDTVTAVDECEEDCAE